MSTCSPALPSPPAAAVVPGSELESPPVVAGAKDEDVSLAELDALRHLAGLQLRPPDRLARLEPLHPAEARDVEQHAAADHAVAVARDIQ